MVKVQNGGNPQEVGTWLHPKLAIDFARWLSSDFAVWCDLQIEKILHSNTVSDNLYEFLKPITETIAIEDFSWRRQALSTAFGNLEKAHVSMTITVTVLGKELLA